MVTESNRIRSRSFYRTPEVLLLILLGASLEKGASVETGAPVKPRSPVLVGAPVKNTK